MREMDTQDNTVTQKKAQRTQYRVGLSNRRKEKEMNIQETMALIKKIDSLWPGKINPNNMENIITGWQEFFANVTFDQMKEALKEYTSSKESTFFPNAPQLMRLVEKKLSENYETPESFLRRIKKAIVEYGSWDVAGAIAYFGDDTWGVLMSVAPWQTHCNRLDEVKLKEAWEYHVRQKVKQQMERRF